MIPRASIVAISQDSSFQNIIDTIDKAFKNACIRKDLDDVLGMIHIKDIIKFSGSES